MRHLVLALATVAGCTGGQPAAPAPANTGPAPSAQVASSGRADQEVGYDLGADEALGGHTIGRHVGKTDDDLAERLRREPQVATASTYTDLATAERVVGAAVARNRGRLQEWLSRSGPRSNLVLTHRNSGGAAIGRSLVRGARRSTPCSAARVVIRWHDRSQRWIVLTSYPEPK